MTNFLMQTPFPTIILSPEAIPEPLGRYGVELLHNLKHNQPDRYWQLIFSGKLMETVYRREKEIKELRLTLLKALEEKYPRPRPASLIEIARHMDILSAAADEVAEKELKKAI